MVGSAVRRDSLVSSDGRPAALLAWVAERCWRLDGFVWSELGAAMPLAGGSYVFCAKRMVRAVSAGESFRSSGKR